MRWLIVILGVSTGMMAGTTPGAAQQGARPGAQRAQMIQTIERRFWARVVEDLGLNNDQATRLRATVRDYSQRRRELERREGELKQALARQLRPGIAADQDSVAKLTNAFLDIRVAYAQSFRDEHRDVGSYLNPVQQAQLLVVRERLMQRIRAIQQERVGQEQ
ncbi:MAG TPA: hypothetical protein VK845_03185 [Gemmatimonadales bacterium]|nr:hypothetical protein [Gemmatimonadales bacterium]